MKGKQLATVTAALAACYGVLSGIAAEKGNTVSAVTVNVNETNLGAGVIKGTCTCRNRSRRPFTLTAGAGGAKVKFYGTERKVAA